LHVRLDRGEKLSRQIETLWVNRGDGCMLHCPGQLAVYPIVPLPWHGLTVGEYLDRLQSGIRNTLAAFRVTLLTREDQYGVWGRGGQLAALGVAVKNWTTYYGAVINVHPTVQLFDRIDTDPAGGTHMSSLLAESGRPVRMSAVRSEVIVQLAAALGCDRYHLHSGHPLLPQMQQLCRDQASRVG
jgi:lipoyl(octanoyl) transferase